MTFQNWNNSKLLLSLQTQMHWFSQHDPEILPIQHPHRLEFLRALHSNSPELY